MKTTIILSSLAATLLSISVLQADALHDSVAKEATQALNNPSAVKGEAAAKAAVEEAKEKRIFEEKMDTNKFHKEVLSDEAKILHRSVTKEVNHQKENFKAVPKDIRTALNQTLFAIDAIGKKEYKAAEDALQQATKAFDDALKADPNLKLVPVANEIEVNAFEGDNALIKKTIKAAEHLLKNNDTQLARAMLLPLQDEMVITSEYLPMDIYPVATKNAIKALHEKKPKEALAILISGLDAIVSDTVIIPIPLLSAQDYVLAAAQIDKSKKKEAIQLLQAAQNELQKAVLLGYTQKHAPAYKSIKKEIKAIEHEIKGKNHVEKLYEHIKESFKRLLGDTRKDVTKNKAEKMVNAYQRKEEQKALKEVNTFKQESKQDTTKTVK